jgi:tRNA (guanine37-N1)-methyltransferase
MSYFFYLKSQNGRKPHFSAQNYCGYKLLIKTISPEGDFGFNLYLCEKIGKMRIDIITVLPEILESPFNYSIIKRAKEKGLVEVYIHNLRDFSEDKHRRVDDYSFSKGAGMVMAIQPIEKAIETLKKERDYDEIIFTTPDGQLFDQREANLLSMKKNIIILCGHYKGVDQRIRDYYITKEISVGDYVLTGGELAAAIIADSVIRLLPGVLSDETSALTDSFQDNLLSPPVYTRPAEYKGMKVPEILLSGNDQLVDDWKHEQSVERTKKLRPDLYKKYMGEI